MIVKPSVKDYDIGKRTQENFELFDGFESTIGFNNVVKPISLGISTEKKPLIERLSERIRAELQAEYDRNLSVREAELREQIEAEIRAEYEKKLRELRKEIEAELSAKYEIKGRNSGGVADLVSVLKKVAQSEEEKPAPVNLSDFEIRGGVLVKYRGKGGKVTVPDKVTVIGYQAFFECSDLTEIVLPSTVTNIAGSAFSRCSRLVSAVIPISVANIGMGAFGACDKLENIVYKGSKAQWRAINKASDWNYFTNDYIVRCTDGNIG